MGDYTNRLPNQNALDAVDELIAWMERRNYLNRSCYEFAGHRDHGSTICPGDPLYGNFILLTIYESIILIMQYLSSLGIWKISSLASKMLRKLVKKGLFHEIKLDSS